MLALTAGIITASAQTWPSRFVTLVVPFGAGSASDTVARILAARLSELLGQQMIVENVAGGGGMVGVSRVAKAAPDGYQVVLGGVDTFAQSQYLFKNPVISAMTDFAPAGLAVEQPLVLVVRKDLPVNNVREFADYVKANQAKMTFGSAGVGAAPHLACTMLTAAIGATAVTHVPYRSSAPALQDLVAGTIDYYCPVSVAAMPLMANNSAKVLAVLTRERSPLFPDLPTAAEQGLNVVDGYYWMGLFLPKGAPEGVVTTLNRAIGAMLDTPAVQARLKDVATTVVPPDQRSTAYLQSYVETEIVKWAGIMKASNVPQQ
ncbi:MAG: tripartite tricarboxylate transporter substrate binding protein [Xanthobacteraceae bacterium]|nr:tripartite tricarboxylate transporter substrate binding protein [Xanthobacteraceae bacterium]